MSEQLETGFLLDRRAQPIAIEGVPLRVVTARDLLREKLRASADPARRRSKRLQDLADAVSLVENDETLATALSEADRVRLESARRD